MHDQDIEHLGPIINPTLIFVNEFPFEVPINFTLDDCPRDLFSNWSMNITDANFPRSGLQRGRKYRAEIYGLNRNTNLETLVEIANAHKRVIGGALGGAVLCSRYGTHLPRDRSVICIDTIEHLWQSYCGIRIPFFDRRGARWNFLLRSLSGGWDRGCFVNFFRELPKDSGA